MILKLDTVRGHEIDTGIREGQISRMALIIATPGEMDALFPQPDMRIRALQTLGLPGKGDAYAHPDYSEYFVKRHRIYAIDARRYACEIIYVFRGLLTIRDTTTLSGVQTQLHPDTFSPLYVTWTDPTN